MLIKRSLLDPIREIGTTMRKLSSGNRDITVPYADRKDEIGDMAQSILVFHEAILERDRLMQAGMGQEKRSAESRRRVLDQMIVQINSVVDGAARGDFAMRVSQSFDEPELKEVSVRLNQLIQTVESGLGETVSALGTLAGGDLTVRVTGSYDGAFRVLSDGTNNLADRLAHAMSQLMTAATAVDTATGEIAAGIDDLAERTADQATTVNETCDALGTFSGSIRDNAQRASAAAQTVRAAEEQAHNGGSVLGAAREAMQRISSSSGRISDIVELIDGIAFQTNLLALNAAVEAARAGDVGRGFAVVASEVRTLAQRAAGASQEIKGLIGQAQAEIVTGVSLVEETSTHLEGIFTAVSDVTRVMTGIADASREQADAVTDLTDAVNKMGDMAQQNAALVEETHAAILTTKQETQQLTALAGSFRLADAQRKAARPARRAA
jgi:methyl-accepting chemotaxis protein